MVSEKEKLEIYAILSSYYDHYDTDTALFYAKKYLSLAQKRGNYEELSIAHRITGVRYDDAGLYDVALYHYSKSMEYLDLQPIPNQESKSDIFHNIGIIKQELREYQEAKKEMFKALSYYRKLQDSTELITSFTAIGSLCWEIEEYDSAILYLKTAANIVKKHFPEDYEWLASIEFERVYSYADKGDLKNAKDLQDILKKPEYMPAYSLYIKAGLKYNDGLINGYEGNYPTSFILLEEVLHLSDSIGLSEEGINVLKKLIYFSEQSRDYERAYKYSQDLINRERKWLDLQKVAYAKSKEIQLNTADKERRLNEQYTQLNQRGTLLVIILPLFLAIVLLAIFLYKNNKAIKRKNDRIESLIRELHHRVKNNLQIISSLLSLQSMRLEEGDAKKAVEEGRSRIKAMAMIHQKLYLQEENSEIDTEEYLSTLIDDLSTSYGFSEKNLKTEINKFRLDIDTILPVGLIVNELVSNAFKYAFEGTENPHLFVKFEKSNENLKLTIQDNGIGLPENYDLQNTTSFGLRLVNLLVKQLRGNLNVNTEKGLSYELTFNPKKMAA